MAIPSGSGTEVLKSFRVAGIGGETTFITGATNHIYTILSVIFSEQAEASDTITMFIEGGGSVVYLFREQIIGAYQTFVFNDKFVMSGDMDLKGYADISGGTGNIDVTCSYIDQDWT